MATPSNYSDNLKRDITDLVLSIDQNVAKIKELSKGTDVPALRTLSNDIAGKLRDKHDSLLQDLPTLVPPEEAKDIGIVLPLKFVTSAAPVMSRQRRIDTAALDVYTKLRGIKDLLDSGEEALKKQNLAKCAETLLKSEDLVSALKRDYSAIFT